MSLTTTATHHDPGAAATALLLEEERERRERLTAVEWKKRAHAAGRLALGAMFVISGLAKAFSFGPTASAIGSLGLVHPGFLLFFIVLVELVGGAMLISGFQVRKASLGLVGYLALVTLVALNDFSVDLNRAFAVANLAFVGALLMVFANGAGTWSIDEWLRRRAARRELSA